MADHDITLYISEMSPPARCVAYFLKYHQITSVKMVTVNLATDEHKAPWFMEFNPHGTVPLLRDETANVTLYESTSMLQYLSEIFEKDGLFGLPKDLSAKYATINALHNIHNFSVKANWDIMVVWYGSVFGDAPFEVENLKAVIEKEKNTRFKVLDQMLAKNGGFIAGKEATCADFRLWTDLFQLSPLGGEVTLGMLDFAEFPAITAYLKYGYDHIFVPNKEFWEPVAGYYQWATDKIGSSDFRLAEKKD